MPSGKDPRDWPPTIWTIGHGRRSTDELVALLHAAGIERVVDVRRFPASRRNPQFSRQRLEADLPSSGLAYEWRGDTLGGRRPPAAEGHHEEWSNPAFRAYAAYMETEAFGQALRDLEGEARSGARIAIMCAETLWWRCHRRLIADALSTAGFDVRHLIVRPPGKLHRVGPAEARP